MENGAACARRSVGCILAELATVRPLFPGVKDIDQVRGRALRPPRARAAPPQVQSALACGVPRAAAQVNRIFTVCGTPNAATWPGAYLLPGWRAVSQLPPHRGQDLAAAVPQLSPAGEARRIPRVCSLACRRTAGAHRLNERLCSL